MSSSWILISDVFIFSYLITCSHDLFYRQFAIRPSSKARRAARHQENARLLPLNYARKRSLRPLSAVLVSLAVSRKSKPRSSSHFLRTAEVRLQIPRFWPEDSSIKMVEWPLRPPRECVISWAGENRWEHVEISAAILSRLRPSVASSLLHNVFPGNNSTGKADFLNTVPIFLFRLWGVQGHCRKGWNQTSVWSLSQDCFGDHCFSFWSGVPANSSPRVNVSKKEQIEWCG
jgi:hypothetical protein